LKNKKVYFRLLALAWNEWCAIAGVINYRPFDKWFKSHIKCQLDYGWWLMINVVNLYLITKRVDQFWCENCVNFSSLSRCHHENTFADTQMHVWNIYMHKSSINRRCSIYSCFNCMLFCYNAQFHLAPNINRHTR
jgi:hypothetical protein